MIMKFLGVKASRSTGQAHLDPSWFRYGRQGVWSSLPILGWAEPSIFISSAGCVCRWINRRSGNYRDTIQGMVETSKVGRRDEGELLGAVVVQRLGPFGVVLGEVPEIWTRTVGVAARKSVLSPAL